MINWVVKQNACTGCSACVDICPQNAIKMLINDLGFLESQVDLQKCNYCNACERVCSGIARVDKQDFNQLAFKAYTKNLKIRKSCSSGGLFGEIASYVLANNGYVFGAVMDKGFLVKHIGVESESKLEPLKKSKYVGSNMTGVYNQIKSLLKKNIKVLFVGTPCQNQGLKKSLNNNYDNLILVDLICHGVDSYKTFWNYVSQVEKNNGAKCEYFDFRSKRDSYINYEYKAKLDNGKFVSEKARAIPCGIMFGDRLTTRESCDNCLYAGLHRVSDITIADYSFGAKEKYKFSEIKKGVSLVLINSAKGLWIFDKIKCNLKCSEITNEEYLKTRILRTEQISKSQKTKIQELIKDNNFDVLNNEFAITKKQKKAIQYSGQLTGSPKQFIYKVTRKFKSILARNKKAN